MRHSGRVLRREIFVILGEHAFVSLKGFSHAGQTLMRRDHSLTFLEN
jgi:hypothetical protein